MDRNVLDGLIVFRLIADNQNYWAAARELGVSVPALSRIIKTLEHRLGVMLLNRPPGGAVTLTRAGERFLTQVRPALDQLLAAIEDAGTRAVKRRD